MSMQIDVAELVGIVCEGVLYGIFVVLSAASLYVLLQKRRLSMGKSNKIFVLVALLMLGLATAQLVVDTTNLFRAFIPFERAGRVGFLLDVTQPIFAAKHSIYFTMMLVGDSIVIYRAYIVWSRNYWVVIVPAICSLGSAISAYQTIWAVSHITSASIKSETSWGLAVFSLSLSANVISTGLISFKLWFHSRRMASAGTINPKSSIGPVAWIVVESGAINAAYLLTYTVVLQSGSHGLEVMACIATPLIGIIFSGVITRAALVSDNERFGGGLSVIPMTAFQTRVNVTTTFTRTADAGTDPREELSGEELYGKILPM